MPMIPEGALSGGAKMVMSTLGKTKDTFVSGAEKILGKGKSVEKMGDAAKGAEKGVEKGAEAAAKKGGIGSKLWKGTKVAGKVGLGAAGVVGSVGGSATKALLGRGANGLGSFMKYGAMAAVLALLANKDVRNNVMGIMSGTTKALSHTATNAQESSHTMAMQEAGQTPASQVSQATDSSMHNVKSAKSAKSAADPAAGTTTERSGSQKTYASHAQNNIQQVTENNHAAQQQKSASATQSHDQEAQL